MVVFELSVPCTRACIMHMGVAYKRVLSNMHCHRGDRRLKLFACVQVRMPHIVAARAAFISFRGSAILQLLFEGDDHSKAASIRIR